jgi:fucose permease
LDLLKRIQRKKLNYYVISKLFRICYNSFCIFQLMEEIFLKKSLLWAQYIGFITIGLVSSIFGPMISAIRHDIPMSYQQTGLILSAQSFGMLIMIIISGLIIDKLGKKPFLLLGGLFLFFGLVGGAIAKSYYLLVASTIIIGFGFGSYEVGIAALCADYNQENPGQAMNYLHFFFGAGAISGPILATISIKTLDSWRFCYALTAIFPLIVSLLLLTSPLPRLSHVSTKNKAFPFRHPFLWFLGLSMLIYVGFEVSIYNWLPVFWQTLETRSSFSPSLSSSVFWLTLSVGRILMSRFSDRIGLSHFLTLASLSNVLIVLGWYLLPPGLTLPLVALIGFALSCVFPVIMACWSGQISSFLIIFSSLGGLLIPSNLGNLADLFGIKILPLALLVLASGLFVTLVIAWGLKRVTS